MSFLSYLRRAAAPPAPAPATVDDLFKKPGTISKNDALRINAVLACVSIISGTIAALPFALYRKTKNGREKATRHPLYKLTQYPCLDMPAYNFTEALIINYLIWGNAYIEMVKIGGQVRELRLAPSSAVSMTKDGRGNIIYTITRADAGSETISSADRVIMQIAGRSFNGWEGKSPVDLCMQSFKLSKALEDFGLAYFERGARPAGFLRAPRKLSEEAVIRLKRSFIEQYAGSKNSGKLIVLEDGLEYEAAQNGNDQSQFLQSRSWQIADIARAFSVPLYMLQETEKSTSWGSGLEQLNISFVQHTLTPILKRLEAAYNYYLLADAERGNYYFEYNTEGLLRGDLKSRAEYYHSALMDGWLSPNEIREKENLPNIPGGDVYYVPLNLQAYAGQDAPAKDGNNER